MGIAVRGEEMELARVVLVEREARNWKRVKKWNPTSHSAPLRSEHCIVAKLCAANVRASSKQESAKTR